MNNRMDKIYNIITRTIMFISSYFPLYIMIIILYLPKIEKGFLGKNILIIIFAALTLILIFISVISVILLKLGKGTQEKVINNNLENPDDTVLSYIMTYIIPLITNGDSSKEVYIVDILLFILIGYIYLRLNLIYLNPLWAMFGYIIYRDANKEIVITNISREVLRHKERLKGYYISNDIFIAHKKDN
ncbi:hypothetical protein [Peptoniphilus sp. EMRHCC_23]|uniref:hypothetical protein n=1 Tax=Peptoniphilus rachelemmaiella TaxID=2811779 RepID=UPI001BFFE1F7|nr:hypothetical protein [Peptoniphilus rachelemmaiella]